MRTATLPGRHISMASLLRLRPLASASLVRFPPKKFSAQRLSLHVECPWLPPRTGCRLRSFCTGANPALREATTRHVGDSTPPECYVVKLTGDDEGIVVLTLNRPQARNALSCRLLAEFHHSLELIKNSPEARVVIIKSEVDNVFCAGADLKERATMSPSEVLQFLDVLRKSFRRLETTHIPTIAAIDGAALGGGLEMALCCDLRIAGGQAKVGLPETKLAIIPGAGGTQRLPRIVGHAVAKELIFTGRVLDAVQAAAYGIVNAAVKLSAYDKALELAREILPQGPIALQMAKIAIDGGMDRSIEEGLNLENQCYDQVIPTEDRMEGLRAFAEKRKPVYTGC